VGALEPFLVQKEARAGSSSEKASDQADGNTVTIVQHKVGCPLAGNASGNVDMSMPGAFASAICRCQVERAESLPPAPNGIVVRNDNNSNNIVRPKKITPTKCDYESISNLREDITNLNHQSLNETLRGSTYVGAVSRSRSLIQCGIDLLMINHRDLAREMFYQLALMKFNGMPMAKLGGGGVDVMASISQMLQFEEDLNSSASSNATLGNDKLPAVKVNKTNADLARQATACLAEKAPMLEEYFSIKLEKVKVYNSKHSAQQVTSLRITGLPILLDGHSPQPHGLPLFLLRLATEVDWAEEHPCFKGVCTELASFYSELPFASSNKSSEDDADDEDANENIDFIDDEAKQYVKHILFPAISFLLVPPRDLANNGAVIKLANLTSLYRVFERC
jgi:DNA mismatch repair protein MLH1